jgi:hypothetical protein
LVTSTNWETTMGEKRPPPDGQDADKTLIDHVEEALGAAPPRAGEQEEDNDRQLMEPPDIPG